jgi:hypothetical protein
VIEKFLTFSPTTTHSCGMKEVRHILKPRYIKGFLDPFDPTLLAGMTLIGDLLPSDEQNTFKLNRYTRDKKFAMDMKIPYLKSKDRKMTEEFFWENDQQTKLQDDFSLRFVPKLRKRMGLDKENQTLESEQNKKIS